MTISTHSAAIKNYSQQAAEANQRPQAEPTAETTSEATFSYNPQDQLVFEPGTITLPGVRQDGSTARFVQDSPLPATDGKYVYDKTDANYHGANAFASAVSTLSIFEEANGRPVKWSHADRLVVHGDEGEDLNAYYDGSGLHFFHKEIGGKTVFSGDSGEVVGHEAGHAILDGLRPTYRFLFSTEPGAFHESFGDVVAMLASLKDERTLDRVIEQTGGDLKKDNISAALGEELGVAINTISGKNRTGGDYTRNAINKLVYADPATLPKDGGGPDTLHPEVHDFSRLWTGAMYDIFSEIASSHIAEGMDPKAALSKMSDEGLKMYTDLFKPGYAPLAKFKFKNMAQALIKSENEQNGGKFTGLIQKVMSDRKILPQSSNLAEVDQEISTGSRPLSTKLEGDRFGQFQGARVDTTLSGEFGTLAEDSLESAELQNDLARLIAGGDIKMTEPNQVVSQRELFKSDGTPFAGLVRWVDGEMTIERTGILS